MTFNPVSKITEIPTLGVEVEYQIVDPDTRELSSNTEVILQEGAEIYGSNIRPEFHAAMVECLTTPCATTPPRSSGCSPTRTGAPVGGSVT